MIYSDAKNNLCVRMCVCVLGGGGGVIVILCYHIYPNVCIIYKVVIK